MSATTTEAATRASEGHVPLAVPRGADTEDWQGLASGDRGGKLKLRGIPTFSNPLAQRQWMKEHMAAAFRFFAKNGYHEGVSGHISMRGTPSTQNSPPSAC